MDGPRLGPTSPLVIWGTLMLAALAAAGVVVSRTDTRGMAAVDPAIEIETLGRDVRRLAGERAELVQRMSQLERGVGELRIAMAATSPSSSDVTGSIGPARAPNAPSVAAIRLGRVGGLQDLRGRWNSLTSRYPAALARLTPRAARSDVGPNMYDLVAGPFATPADAELACADLAAAGLACDTTVFVGEPLGRS